MCFRTAVQREKDLTITKEKMIDIINDIFQDELTPSRPQTHHNIPDSVGNLDLGKYMKNFYYIELPLDIYLT